MIVDAIRWVIFGVISIVYRLMKSTYIRFPHKIKANSFKFKRCCRSPSPAHYRQISPVIDINHSGIGNILHYIRQQNIYDIVIYLYYIHSFFVIRISYRNDVLHVPMRFITSVLVRFDRARCFSKYILCSKKLEYSRPTNCRIHKY